MGDQARQDREYPHAQVEKWARAEKTLTFAGAVTNDVGDFDGTGNPATLFTITGDVIVKVIGICVTTLTGAAATLEVGVVGNTAGLIAQTTGTDIDANEIWHDATPDNEIELSSVLLEKIIANGLDIINTVATANVTAGVIRYVCLWKPLSVDGNVVAA